MRRFLVATALLFTAAFLVHTTVQAAPWTRGVSPARLHLAVRTGARNTRQDAYDIVRDSRPQPVVDGIVRGLETLKLKSFAKRMLARAPRWVSRLYTRDIRQRTRLIDEHVLTRRFEEAVSLLRAKNVELGDYLEFGVYNGSSLWCMHRVLEKSGSRSRLVGFDSFEGLPPVAATDSGGYWAPGAFKSSLDFTTRVLDYKGVDWRRVRLVKGYFADTLTPELRADLGITRASLVMIDCDLYQSTKEALAFCAPLVVDHSVIFFDDWFPLADRNLGERKAFEEWLAADATLRARELFTFPLYGKAFLVTREPAATATTDA